MRLGFMQDLTSRKGPFATAVVDATHEGPNGEHELGLRSAAQARRLADLGAPDDVVAALAPAATATTRRGGKVGRVVVAGSEGVLLDLVLPEPPVREEVAWGPVPHLMPAVRARAGRTSYLLAEVDAAGADLRMVSATGLSLDETEVQGEHELLHKVPGGWADLVWQYRIQDSIDHNAHQVGEEMGRLVNRYGADVVLVTGTEKPVASLLGRLPRHVADRVVRLSSGGRADGTDDAALQREIQQVLEQHDGERRADLLDRFSSAHGRQQEAVQGLAAVVETLQRGQVDHLLLHDDPSSTLTLWTTGQPEQLATSPADLEAMGAQEVHEVRADAALVWALAGTGASITLLAEDELGLVDGIGAVLRWADASTPHDAVPSMPGHGQPGTA